MISNEGDKSLSLRQTRRRFLGNALGVGMKQIPTAPVASGTDIVAQILADPTKGLKAAEIVVDGVRSMFEPTKSKIEVEVRKPDIELLQSTIDFNRSLGYLEQISSIPKGASPEPYQIGKVGVIIGEVDGDVSRVLAITEKFDIDPEIVLKVYRAADKFAEAEDLSRGRKPNISGLIEDLTEHVAYKSKRGRGVTDELEEIERLYQEKVRREGFGLHSSVYTDIALANFRAGTRSHPIWLNRARKALNFSYTNIHKRYGEATVEVGDLPESLWLAKETFEPYIVDPVVWEMVDRLIDQRSYEAAAQVTGTRIDAVGSKWQSEVKPGSSYFSGFEGFKAMNAALDFYMTGRRYDDLDRSGHRLMGNPDKSFWNHLRGRMNLTRALRLLGMDGEYEGINLHLLGESATFTTTKGTFVSSTATAAYRDVIELQTRLGDIDAARATFAQLEDHFKGNETKKELLFAKAENLARIGAAQKKKELKKAA